MSGLVEQYGIEENTGFHVILSNLIWWSSVILMITAYRYRDMWKVGYAPWAYLFSGFLFFGLRELGHFSTSPVIGSLRYIFGICSAIFMTSAFVLFYMVLYKRKIINGISNYLPVSLAMVFPFLMIYLYFSSTGMNDIKTILSTLESLAWMLGSSVTIYTTFMLGTRASGGFVSVFMFSQFSAFAAFTWKLLGLLELISWSVPYSIREIIETLFGVFAFISVYLLTRMLTRLSRDIHGHKS
ncbi:Uncharacterised protein [uncultured archaeon]|nr:Uncharacterised protein [uncultured archaeon]